MEGFSLFVEILVVGLILGGIITIIRYPLDIIRSFLNFIRPSAYRPATIIFLPIWIIAWTLNRVFDLKIIEPRDGNYEDMSEEPYKSTKNLKFDFEQGNKYLISNTNVTIVEDVIKDFLGFSFANIKLEDFTIEKSSPTMYKCPNNIPFYDFNLLVQHASNEIKTTESYGLFKSDEIGYYCYQDTRSTHNIVGKTNLEQKFSVYTLDDLNKKVHLRINSQVQVDELKIDV